MKRNIITMSRLGKMGRWGNQLLQYCFLEAYRRDHGFPMRCDFEYNAWAGQHLLNVPSHPITTFLTPCQEKYGPDEQPVAFDGPQLVNHDAVGWFQVHTSWWTPERRKVWGRLAPSPEQGERVYNAVETLLAQGNTIIGVQIRRGDYSGKYPWDHVTPVEWYVSWLQEHWESYDAPVLFLASEDRAVLSAFDLYQPYTVESLGIKLYGDKPYTYYNYLDEDKLSKTPHLVDWFPEWLMLTYCDVLLAANSTFSFSAALASHRVRSLWRPDVSAGQFREEDKWDCWPLRKDNPHKA